MQRGGVATVQCCVCMCVRVQQFTGSLLSVCRCCEPLHGYYDNSTGLSVSLQSPLLGRGGTLGRVGALGWGGALEREFTVLTPHDQDTLHFVVREDTSLVPKLAMGEHLGSGLQ